jgi:hypothetical protein
MLDGRGYLEQLHTSPLHRCRLAGSCAPPAASSRGRVARCPFRRCGGPQAKPDRRCRCSSPRPRDKARLRAVLARKVPTSRGHSVGTFGAVGRAPTIPSRTRRSPLILPSSFIGRGGGMAPPRGGAGRPRRVRPAASGGAVASLGQVRPFASSPPQEHSDMVCPQNGMNRLTAAVRRQLHNLARQGERADGGHTPVAVRRAFWSANTGRSAPVVGFHGLKLRPPGCPPQPGVAKRDGC